MPGDSKHHCGPSVRIGAYGGQVINVGSISQWAQWVLKAILWLFPQFWNAYKEIHPELVESQHWFPDLWSKGYHGSQGQVKVTRIASTYKNSKSEIILHF